jgi:peptidoglycan/xylan/chitin deacetylase (PgdA/CDA1 family)
MIDVLADNGRSLFGVAAALDMERVPWRRIARAEDCRARALVVAARELDASAAAVLRRVPAVVLGVPRGLPADVFGPGATAVDEGPLRLAVDDAPLSATVRAQARRLGVHELCLPRVSLGVPQASVGGTVLAVGRRGDGPPQPVIVAAAGAPHTLWALADLGAALADLMDEGYRPEPPAARPIPRPVLAVYYRAPEVLRRVVQRRAYRGLEAALAALGERASAYPVDASGWLLVELLLGLVRRAAGGLVRLARWPAPFDAAAALTHDLEPCRWAYRRGLRRLLDRVTVTAHPATFGVVARPAARHLGARSIAALDAHEVICHGLEHRGETVVGTREEMAHGLEEARRRVETTLGRPVTGFRSPRLDRSRDLLWALDRAGLHFDSSWPDVDRENLHAYGTGVRLNVPFRPPVTDAADAAPRPSRCLELPVSAPDCIQPLFEGASPWALRAAVRAKVAFLRETGGLYVGIVHAGVFGARDADRREAHLRFVARLVSRPGVWLASLREVAGWWRARERVTAAVDGERVLVTNGGAHPVTGLRVVLEQDDGSRVLSVPTVPPGATVVLDAGAHPHAAAS